MKKIQKKIPRKFIEIYDPIFSRRINILLNYSPEEYYSWLTRNKIKYNKDDNFSDLAGFCTYIEDENGQTEILIYINPFDWTILCQGTLIHEITHAVVRIFNLVNIPFTTETQEFFAHMIGRIYEDIAEKIVNK